MIDLTPLDVRKKRGDFGKGLRGYDPQEVDTFLELVAERLEEVVKENMTLRERAERLADQVNQQTGREKAVQDALVTAQQLRDDIRTSAEREGDLVRREAESEAKRVVDEAKAKARAIMEEAERVLHERREALGELERRRGRFLTAFRQLLERELDVVHVEEGRSPLKDVPIDLDLRGGRDESEDEDVDEPTDPDLEFGAAIPDTDEPGATVEDGAEWVEPVGAGGSEESAPRDPGELRLVSDDDAEDRPDAHADVHSMADAVGALDDEGNDDSEWLDEILGEEADQAEKKRRDEGEW